MAAARCCRSNQALPAKSMELMCFTNNDADAMPLSFKPSSKGMIVHLSCLAMHTSHTVLFLITALSP